MNKQITEKEILNHVYTDIDFDITKSEDPDFKLTEKSSGISFGAEITRMYYSETSARAKYIDDYLGKALHSPSQIDKRDSIRLKPWDFTVVDEFGNPVSEPVKGVLLESPKWPEYTCRVINCIVEKENKLKNYDKELKHIDLIIFDMECGFRDIPYYKFEELFTQKGIGKDLAKYLNQSRFNNIYFITDLLYPEGVKKRNLSLKDIFLK